MKRVLGLALLALAAAAAAAVAAAGIGSTFAAFTAQTNNTGSNVTAASDFRAPTLTPIVIQKASGGTAVRSTRAVMTPSMPPVRSTPSTARPSMERVSDSAVRSSPVATKSRSQERRIFIRIAPRSGCRR